MFFEEKYMREKSSLRCLSVHYICVTSLEAFQWPPSKLPLNQGKIILSIKIIHLFVIEILATKIQGVFFNSLLIFSCLWFQYYLKHNDKDTKFWTECVSREFIILSLFFLLAMFPFIHITIDLLRDQFLFISAAVDSLLIQLVTFHEFRIQTTPFRFSERNLFEQINIHREAAVKRRTTKLKFTVALLNPIFTSFTLIRIPGSCYVF